jgi:hypothetical protein
MKLILWIGVEINDTGSVKIFDGSWSIVKSASEAMPDGDAVAVVASRFAELGLRESSGGRPPTAHAADGRPAPTTPRASLMDDLQQLGIGGQEATELCNQYGAGRIASLLKWIAQKNEPVGNPARLLRSCLAKPKDSPLP